jgi:hypothetical protein
MKDRLRPALRDASHSASGEIASTVVAAIALQKDAAVEKQRLAGVSNSIRYLYYTWAVGSADRR